MAPETAKVIIGNFLRKEIHMKNLEKMKNSSDYPYGYAYDYIRNTVNEKNTFKRKCGRGCKTCLS